MPAATAVPAVILTRVFNAPRERVFAAWTNPAMMNQWFAPSTAFRITAQSEARKGGNYEVEMDLHKLGEMHTAIGEYLEIVPPEKIVFTWRWKEHHGADGSIVTVELRDLGGKTELTLTHALIQEEEQRYGHTQGWTGAINRLGLLFNPQAEQHPIPGPPPNWVE